MANKSGGDSDCYGKEKAAHSNHQRSGSMKQYHKEKKEQGAQSQPQPMKPEKPGRY